MSVTFTALIAWGAMLPLTFAAMVLLLPRHLHRRATRKLGAFGAEVVQLDAARERRARLVPTRSSRAL